MTKVEYSGQTKERRYRATAVAIWRLKCLPKI